MHSNKSKKISYFLLFFLVNSCDNLSSCHFIDDDCAFNNYETTCSPETSKLVYTSVNIWHKIFRHGERYPDPFWSYPSDPHGNHSYFPKNLGELTQRGLLQLYNLGKYLRNYYRWFLGDVYYQNLVYSVTDTYKRCQESLQALHAGMFPPKQNKIFGFHWQPIPYDIIPDKEDFTVGPHLSCPGYMVYHDSPKKPDAKTQELFDYLQLYSGFENVNHESVMSVYDRTECELAAGLEMPEWIEPIWPEPLRSQSQKYWDTFYGERLRYGAGGLIKEITNTALTKANNTLTPTQRKITLYSGHDINIVFVLKALNMYHLEPIEYASVLIFELHEICGIFGFKIFLKNGEDKDPVLLNMPNCGIFCPLDKFVKVTKWTYDPKPICGF